MALLCKTGTFTKDDSGVAGTSQPVTGIGFQPKALLIWTEWVTATGITNADAYYSIGIYDGTNQRGIGVGTENAQATSDTARTQSNSHIIRMINPSTLTGINTGVMTSLDSDGFTIRWDINDTDARIIHYMAWAGDDIEVAVGSSNLTTVDGVPVEITTASNVQGIEDGKGMVMILLNRSTANAAALNAQLSVGITTSSDNSVDGDGHGAMSIAMEDNRGTSDTWRLASDKFGATMLIQNTGFVDLRSTVEFTATGFKMNQELASALASRVNYLIIKGGAWKALVTQDDESSGAQSQVIDGIGFTPKGVLGFSVEEDVLDDGVSDPVQGKSHGKLTTGGYDGTNQNSTHIFDRDGQTTTATYNSDTDDKIITAINNSGTATEIATLSDLESDKFTLNFTTKQDNSGINRLWLAFGDESSIIKPKRITGRKQRRFWPPQNIIKVPHIFNFSLVPKAPLQKKIIREKIVSSVVSMPVVKQVMQMVSPRLSVTLKEHAEEQKTITVPTDRVHSEQHSITITITKSHLMTAVLRYQDTLITNDPILDAIILDDDVALANALENEET